MSPIKSTRQLAIEGKRSTYVGIGCKRCGGRKRYTNNAACKNCQDKQRNALMHQKREHAKILAATAPSVPTTCCPTCGRPWPVDGDS